MNRQRMVMAVAGFSLTFAVAWTAQAQMSSQGGPVQYSADRIHTDQTTHTTFLDGRVEMLQDNARLRSDHAKIISAESGGVVSAIADGNVYYVTTSQDNQQTIVRGDNAVYTKADDTMIVTGDVVLQQGQSVANGTRLVSHPKAGDSTLDSSPTSESKGRVRGVFYPTDTKAGTPAAGSPPTAPAAGSPPTVPAPAAPTATSH